jgi:hypothetical protein
MQTKAQKNKETTSSVSSDAAQSTASQLWRCWIYQNLKVTK